MIWVIFADFGQIKNMSHLCRLWEILQTRTGQKFDRNYSKVTNLLYLKTINLFTAYFVYNFVLNIIGLSQNNATNISNLL